MVKMTWENIPWSRRSRVSLWDAQGSLVVSGTTKVGPAEIIRRHLKSLSPDEGIEFIEVTGDDALETSRTTTVRELEE